MSETPLVTYRQPSFGRWAQVVFGLVWCGVLGSFTLRAVRDGGSTVGVAMPAVMLVLGVAATLRGLRVGADLFGDELVVRNFGRTRRIHRSDVEDVRIGPAPDEEFDRTIHLHLRDGRPVKVQAMNSRDEDTLVGRRDELRAWRSGRLRRAGS